MSKKIILFLAIMSFWATSAIPDNNQIQPLKELDWPKINGHEVTSIGNALVSKDYHFITLLADGSSIHIYDYKSGKLLYQNADILPSSVSFIKYIENDQQVLLMDHFQNAKIIDLETGKTVAHFKNAGNGGAYHARKKTIIGGISSNTTESFLVYSNIENKKQQRIRLDKKLISSAPVNVRLSSNEEQIYFGEINSKKLFVHDITNNKTRLIYDKFKHQVSSIVIFPELPYIFCVDSSNDYLYSFDNTGLADKIEMNANYKIKNLSLKNSSSRYILSSSLHGLITIDLEQKNIKRFGFASNNNLISLQEKKLDNSVSVVGPSIEAITPDSNFLFLRTRKNNLPKLIIVDTESILNNYLN